LPGAFGINFSHYGQGAGLVAAAAAVNIEYMHKWERARTGARADLAILLFVRRLRVKDVEDMTISTMSPRSLVVG
jgi:hypothetical protein